MVQRTSQAQAPAGITDVVWDWFTLQIARVRGANIPGWVWVLLLWILMAFPAVSLRGTHFEEGTVIGLARGAVEDGHWLSPHLYGVRFVERPVLLSWIAAGLGAISGGVTVWSARIPHLLMLLAGGLMVFDLVRSQTRTAPAVIGALCWFACPMIAQKFVAAEPDVSMSVLMFGGFYLWWQGVSKGQVSLPRWLVIGCLLAAAGLTKGPQPLAYFVLGVGAYLLIKRRWTDISGFLFANAIAGSIIGAWYWAVMGPGDLDGWKAHSRLSDGMSWSYWLRDHLDFLVSIFVEWLPGSLLLGPAIIAIIREKAFRDRNLMLALVLYGSLSSIVLLVWPGGVASRYAMPANLPLAVLGGILFDRWWSSRPWLIGASNTVVLTMSCYLVVLGWIVLPAMPDVFRQSRTSAQVVSAVRGPLPGTLLVSHAAANYNLLAYVTGPIRQVTLSDIERLKVPAFAILTSEEISTLVAEKSNFRVVPHAALTRDLRTKIVEILPN